MTDKTRLFARDAMTAAMTRISAEMRPPRRVMPIDQQFAVFDEEHDSFLGLVGISDIAPHPHRIFADLIHHHKQAIIPDDTPIETLPGMFDGAASALAVHDSTGRVIGAITQDSLMRRLLSWHIDTRDTLIATRQKSDRLTHEIRELAHHQLTYLEDLRRAMSRELHDEAAQCCAALKWHAEFIKDCCPPSLQERILDRADSIISISDIIQHGLRKLIKDLRPELLDTTDLATAIEELVADWRQRHTRCKTTLTLNRHKCPVGDPVKTHIYRIIQESLNNISRHSAASRVDISLGCAKDPKTGSEAIQICIRDNGIGYDPIATPRGLGLIGLEERVRSISGTLSINTMPSAGVQIEIEIPLTDT